jgi:hypothetical protein
MLKFIVSAAVLLTSSSIASACSVEGRIDDAVYCERLANSLEIQLASKASSTNFYNRHTYIINPNGGPARVIPKYRGPRRPR